MSQSPRRGGAVVELAVLLPVLVLVTLGTIEATHMIFLRQGVLIAAHEGARVSLVASTNSGNVKAACEQVLSARRIRGATIEVSPSNFPQQPYGTFVQVTVTVPCKGNSPIAPWFYADKSMVGAR